MKTLSLFAVCMALLWGCGREPLCHRFSYAEVQHMSHDELASTYSFEEGGELIADTFYKMSRRQADSLNPFAMLLVDSDRHELEVCNETMATLRAAMVKRGLPCPQCETPKPTR